MSIFDSLNRKEKRNFTKMPKSKQAELIQAALIEKISPVMSTEITKAMITGMDLLWSQLYVDFVEKIDAAHDSFKEKELIDALLSLIREKYIAVQARKAKEDLNKKDENEVEV